jgi:hypothetical protein
MCEIVVLSLSPAHSCAPIMLALLVNSPHSQLFYFLKEIGVEAIAFVVLLISASVAGHIFVSGGPSVASSVVQLFIVIIGCGFCTE